MATRRRICRIRVLAENLPVWRIRVLAKMAILAGLDTFARHSPTTFPGLDTFDQHSPTTFPGLDTFAKGKFTRIQRIQRIQRVWRIQRVQTRPFYTYKICYLCIKRPILLAPTIANLFWSDSIHSPDIRRIFANHFPRTRYIRPTFANHFPRTRYIRSHSPKAIFEKNVTRLDTFARVIRHFGEFGASGHCLIKVHMFQLIKCSS